MSIYVCIYVLWGGGGEKLADCVMVECHAIICQIERFPTIDSMATDFFKIIFKTSICTETEEVTLNRLNLDCEVLWSHINK